MKRLSLSLFILTLLLTACTTSGVTPIAVTSRPTATSSPTPGPEMQTQIAVYYAQQTAKAATVEPTTAAILPPTQTYAPSSTPFPTSTPNPTFVPKTPVPPVVTSVPSELPATGQPGVSTGEPTGQPGSTPAGANPLHDITDLAFLDSLRGWLVGTSCQGCAPALRVTRDGGRTWTGLPAPQTAAGQVHHVRFSSSSDGFLFGPGFFITHDGGRTWADSTGGKRWDALEISGTSVWAAGGTCDASQKCSYQLQTSLDGGKTWQAARAQLPISGPLLQLERSGRMQGWIISGGENGSSTLHLSSTRDGGSTWTESLVPCSSARTARLSALDGQNLWLLCGEQPAAGQQRKSLYASTDGGITWTLAATPPSAGYVDDVAYVSTLRNYIALGRSTILYSDDGGQIWFEGVPKSDANPGDSSGWRLFFINDRQGWTSLGGKVFYTQNGGMQWTAVEVR